MSLYSSPGGIRPGPVQGKATEGLGHRVAVNVRRVLDCCVKKVTQNAVIAVGKLKNLHGEVIAVEKKLYKPPLRYISAYSKGSVAVVRDLMITRLEERPVFARIRCNVDVPLWVNFEDVGGRKCLATAHLTVPQDIILYVPEASAFPFEVTASSSCTCTSGRYVATGEFAVTACLTIVTRVIAETDLLVPAYGICPTPDAVDTEAEASKNFFDLPLYPRGRSQGQSSPNGGMGNTSQSSE